MPSPLESEGRRTAATRESRAFGLSLDPGGPPLSSSPGHEPHALVVQRPLTQNLIVEDGAHGLQRLRQAARALGPKLDSGIAPRDRLLPSVERDLADRQEWLAGAANVQADDAKSGASHASS